MKGTTIGIPEAADRLGVSRERIRQYIKAGIWSFGEYIPKEKSGKSCDAYIVYADLLEEHIRTGGKK